MFYTPDAARPVPPPGPEYIDEINKRIDAFMSRTRKQAAQPPLNAKEI